MRAWKVWLGSLLLVLGGCGHSAHDVREEFGARGEEGVRTKGGSTATARLPVLLAQGRYAEAELLLVALVKAGQLTRVQEEEWRQQVNRLKEQHPGPGRNPPPVSPWRPDEDDPPQEGPTCGTKFPAHPICRALPEEYSFASQRLALEAMKQRLGQKNLSLHNEDPAQKGPCPRKGTHFNVRLNGERMGSIACCKCCVEMQNGPIEWGKCRIVW